MCITLKKKRKINKIYPVSQNIKNTTNKSSNKNTYNYSNSQIENFTELFSKEIIICGGCNKAFNLGSNELQISCAGCNKFFHCHIGGMCKCDKCTVIMPDRTTEYLKYCLNCCDPYTSKNGYCKCTS